MHSHDRTLLASLGFSDPDKKSPLHDLACQFLTLSSSAKRIISMFGCREPDIAQGYPSIEVERAITKGEGQYKTTIGFLDVVVRGMMPHVCKSKSCCDPTPKDEWQNATLGSIIVEVKVNKISISDVIRQINLYAQFTSSGASGRENWSRYLLATTWPLTDSELRLLNMEKIKHVLLGESFNAYVEKSEQSKPSQNNVEF